MLWDQYVFRRGGEAHALWDDMFKNRPVKLLYITGRGFDVRAQETLGEFVTTLKRYSSNIQRATMLMISFDRYQLSPELISQTEANAQRLESIFSSVGDVRELPIGSTVEGEDDISASNVLRHATAMVLAEVTDETDVVLDVSSLPRVAYLSLLCALLNRFIPDKSIANAPGTAHVNFQVLVAEDPVLDSQIRSEDPSNELVYVPGFVGAMHGESYQDWPMVWFPILGENRTGQLQKVLNDIPSNVEICPVLPNPSRNPRRADKLLIEYQAPLFDTGLATTGNVIYTHEAHPFEVYRQLRQAMERYRRSLEPMGGCRLVVTPLGSKLITLGAALACFEMRPKDPTERYGVSIPYAEPTRYSAPTDSFGQLRPEISTLLLTGEAYSPN